MAQRRPRLNRRNALVFLGSFLAHALFFFFAARELMVPYRLPMPMEPAIQAELIPPEPTMPPILPPPIPTPPKPTPVPPTPTPRPQPVRTTPAPPQPAPRMVVKPTAPAKVAGHPTLAPTERPVEVISPLAPPTVAPQPGPPQEQPHAALAAEQPHVVGARNNPKLKRNSENPNGVVANPSNLPSFTPAGAAAPPGGGQSAGAGAGAPGGGGAGGFPGGSLPSGFGSGLRGSLLGCIDSGVAKLTPEEQARCNARLGADAKSAPVMDPIGSTERHELDTEQQQEQAAQKYRDEMPTGSVDQTIPGQPRLGHKPGGP